MSQHRRAEAAEAGHRSIFNHFTPSGPAAHWVEEVTRYLGVTSASAGVMDKLREASLCLREAVSFAEPISPVCLQSGGFGTDELQMSTSACLLLYSSAWTEPRGDN